MKLVFPGGEHPQVLLGPGINRIGSDPHANIVIDRPGVRPQHCELHVNAHGVTLHVPPGTSVTVMPWTPTAASISFTSSSLNGLMIALPARLVDALISFRARPAPN